MRVGIVTFHDASNYGACLQAQATVDAFSRFNIDVEIVDYSNDFRLGIYSPKARIFESIRKLDFKSFIFNILASPGIIRRNSKFKSYRGKFIRISEREFRSTEDLRKSVFEYDVIVSGSDQIWSYRNNGYDFNYLLGFVEGGLRKISYASSFGLLSIPESLQSQYKACLGGYDFLSTREESGVDLIRSLIGRDGRLVLDPVLLHDKEYWNKFATDPLGEENYDLLYVNNTNVINKIPFNKKIISIGSFRPNFLTSARVSLRNHEGPSEFIGYIKNADFIYTTSYHAVILCLIYNKPFYAFLSGNEGRDSRIISLLKIFNLENRLVESESSIANWNDQVDFSAFNHTISALRSKSYGFIENALYSDGKNEDSK